MTPPNPGTDLPIPEQPEPPEQETTEETEVQAKDAGVSPELVRQAVADAAGARTQWLAPLSEELDRLARLAQDQNVTDEELQRFCKAAADRLPDLFAEMDPLLLADSLEKALGAAALSGVRDAVADQTHKSNEP